MEKRIGFIGGGAMCNAIIGGIVKAEILLSQNIIASDISSSKLEELKSEYGINITQDNLAVASFADILFLAVKPNMYADVINQIKDAVKKDVTIVVIALGQTLEKVQQHFGKPLKIVRTMPNTPALVGAGMTALCKNNLVTEQDMKEVMHIFESFGKAEIISENLMNVIPGISGSSPAYVFMFIEAMADAAVAEGMPRVQAYQFSAQAVLGAAKMVLETNIHPAQLKDNVCSPGGSTIAAVCELESLGFRNAVISAVQACTQKSRDMESK